MSIEKFPKQISILSDESSEYYTYLYFIINKFKDKTLSAKSNLSCKRFKNLFKKQIDDLVHYIFVYELYNDPEAKNKTNRYNFIFNEVNTIININGINTILDFNNSKYKFEIKEIIQPNIDKLYILLNTIDKMKLLYYLLHYNKFIYPAIIENTQVFIESSL